MRQKFGWSIRSDEFWRNIAEHGFVRVSGVAGCGAFMKKGE